MLAAGQPNQLDTEEPGNTQMDSQNKGAVDIALHTYKQHRTHCILFISSLTCALAGTCQIDIVQPCDAV